MKKPKLNFNIEKNLPYLLLALFVIISVSITGYVYWVFNRSAEQNVVEEAATEIKEVDIQFSETEISNLFEKTPELSDIEGANTQSKNPFIVF